MLFQKKTGLTSKKEEEKPVNEQKLVNDEKSQYEAKLLNEEKLLNAEKLRKEKELARFEEDIKFHLLWNALTKFAHSQLYEEDIVAVWNEVAIQVKKRINEKDIALVDNLVLDGNFMQVTCEKYMTEFCAKHGKFISTSGLELDNDFMMYKIHDSRFKRYEIVTDLSASSYEEIQTKQYLARKAKLESELELTLQSDLQELNESKSLKEELKRKDKIIDELKLENKGLIKINEELKNTGKC